MLTVATRCIVALSLGEANTVGFRLGDAIEQPLERLQRWQAGGKAAYTEHVGEREGDVRKGDVERPEGQQQGEAKCERDGREDDAEWPTSQEASEDVALDLAESEEVEILEEHPEWKEEHEGWDHGQQDMWECGNCLRDEDGEGSEVGGHEDHLDQLAGGDPLGETPVGLRVHMLVRAKPEKEQERGRRAEKRAQREGRQ